jgi:hypothetical protein
MPCVKVRHLWDRAADRATDREVGVVATLLEPSLTSSSSSWSNVSGFQLVAPDAIAASSASFDG